MTEYLEGFGTLRGIATVLLLVLVGGALIALIARKVTSAKIAPMILAAVVFDVGVLLAIVTVLKVLSGDANTWHSLASEAGAYLNGEIGEAVTYVGGKEGYIWILGGVYAFAGPVPMVGMTLGILFHLAVVVAVAKSTELLLESDSVGGAGGATAVRRAALLAAVLPAIVWWSPQLLRESLTMMLYACVLCFVLLALVRKKFWPLIVVGLAIGVLTWVRSSLGLILAVATFAVLVYIVAGRSRYHLFFRLILFVGVGSIFPVLQGTLAGTLNVSESFIVDTTAELSVTASSGFPGLGFGLGIAQVLSITVPRVLIGPFVWEVDASAVMLLAFMELLCWVLVVILSLRSAKYFRKRGALSDSRWLVPAILVMTAIVLIGLTIVVGNYGILARFRPVATVLLLPLAGIGATRIGLLRPVHRVLTGKIAGSKA